MKQSLLSLKVLIGFYLTFATIFLISPLLISKINVGGMMFMSIFTFGLAFFHYKVRSDLLQKKYWAWIASIVVFGITTLSILFPLGILGMIGVLKKETRATFDK